jgi:soluble P-type ATPase
MQNTQLNVCIDKFALRVPPYLIECAGKVFRKKSDDFRNLSDRTISLYETAFNNSDSVAWPCCTFKASNIPNHG